MPVQSRAIVLILAAFSALLAACGPNALPVRERSAAPEEASLLSAAPQAPVPAAQLFGPGHPEGRLLFVRDGNLWLWERGNAFEAGIGHTWYQPRWSPDGKQIAYVYRTFNFSEIFTTDAKGSDQTRLTRSQSRVLDDNDWNFRPTWSPDGKQIAYVSDAGSSHPVLWVMNAADGSGKRQVRMPGVDQAVADELSWSPDGSTIAATVFGWSGPSQVALVPADGRARQARLLTEEPGGAMDPAWSPDGRWLAYAAREGRATDVFVVRADGTGRQRVTAAGLVRAPAWSPNGKHLAFLSGQTGAFEVWAVDVQERGGSLETSSARQLTRDLGLEAPSGLSWGR